MEETSYFITNIKAEFNDTNPFSFMKGQKLQRDERKGVLIRR